MIRYLTLCMALLAAGVNAAEQPKKQVPEPWYYKLARILGVDRTPVSLKGPSGFTPGELWIVSTDHVDPRRLTEGNGFTSPVFQPPGQYVFALRGSDLVRVPSAGGAVVTIRNLPRIVKLVGFDRSDPDRLLALFKAGPAGNADSLDVVLISVKTGKLRSIASKRPADTEEVAGLLGWQRQYGNIYVRPQGGEIVVGGIEAVEIPVSDCRDADCGQPSYSPALRQVAFIRSVR